MPAALTHLILLAGTYLLGCLSPGYYLCRLKTGGAPAGAGAMRVSPERCGRLVYTAGVVLEACFGWIAVEIWWRYVEWPEQAALAAPLVALGAIYPIQLRFKGGHGLAGAGGALLNFQPTLVFLWLSAAGVFRAFLGKTDLAWLASLISLPILAHLLGNPPLLVVVQAALAVILFVPQRFRVRRMLADAKIRLKH